MNTNVEVLPPTAASTRPGGGGSGDEPTLVLIFGWLGGKSSVLQKYSDAYQRIYPTSVQIVILADPLRYWKSESARERAVLPAVQKLEELGVLSNGGQPKTPPRILIQVMSNGGVMSLVDFANAIRKRKFLAPASSKCAILFDSCPSPPTLPLVFRAYTAGIRSHFKMLLAGLIIVVLYFFAFLWHMLSRSEEPLRRAIAQLDDLKLLPWTSVRTPRMYFYSSGDKIVPESTVVEHAARARMAGLSVQMVNFGKSDHVMHAKDHPEKYWNAVRTFWSEAVQQLE